MDWWMGWIGGVVWVGGLVDWWSGSLQLEIGGLVEWKLAAWGSEVCKSLLARATAMGRRIIGMIIIFVMFYHFDVYSYRYHYYD